MNESPQLQDAAIDMRGHVATLTFRRDDVRNELTGTQLVSDIEQTVDWVNANEHIRALILTGEGRAFSSGGNVKDMRDRKGTFGGNVYEVQNSYRQGIQRIPLAMHRLEVPSIAAMNGPAIGAGFDLACMCDIRVAARGAVMAESFVNVGIIPGDGGAWFLQRLIGYQRAAELTFSGRAIDADEAKALGLVLDVVEPELLHAHTQALGQSLANKPPQALRLTKRLMKLAQRADLADFLQISAAFQGMCHNTEDHAEAVGAMLEKRAPKFRGM